MQFLQSDVDTPLGMGCWAIGGPFYAGEKPLGFAQVNDEQSKRTIAAALDCGIRLFDTAAVYGAGHSEELLGQCLGNRDDVSVVTKLGVPFDSKSKQLLDQPFRAEDVMPSIEASLRRLKREFVDVVLLHKNETPVADAEPLFEQMSKALDSGKVRAFGWSTDFPASAEAMSGTDGFTCVEHAMNVFADVPTMSKTIQSLRLTALIRSPLAMGVLTGKFAAESQIAEDDIRSTHDEWRDYFSGAKVKAEYLNWLEAVKELLMTDGRTPAQGALAWLWAKSDRNIPLPGARTPEQVIENAAAMQFGPLQDSVMQEIESVIVRPAEGKPRAR